MYDRSKKVKKFKILIPLFNDWKSVSQLLNKIDFEINKWEAEVSIIIVNDASNFASRRHRVWYGVSF